MVKVGDKVVVVSAGNGDIYFVGDTLVVTRIVGPYGFWAGGDGRFETYARTEDMNGSSTVIVRPYTETEAERRGAKFGVMGVVKGTGEKCIYMHETPINPEHWDIVIEGQFGLFSFDPSEIRLDHEPDFVDWKDAPEELKYDASRVYHEGEPVKWIAKPDGAKYIDVVFVTAIGNVCVSTDDLTVKL